MGQIESTVPNTRRLSRLARRAAIVSCWAYLVAVVILWIVLRQAESWWPATILLFSPRWVFALPLALLIPVAMVLRSIRLLFVLLVSGVVVVVLVMSFNIPWQTLTASRPPGKAFRVMTLNMHYSKKHPAELENLIDATWPDVVAIQEWPGSGESHLKHLPEWHIHSTPRLFLASRHPIRRAVELGEHSMGEQALAVRYELETSRGVVNVFNLHAASNREGIAETIRNSRKGSGEIRANSALRREQMEYIAGQARSCSGPIIVLGDFNTPSGSPMLSEVWSGYTDAFGAAGWGLGYTFIGAKTMVRIDHVLVSKEWGVTGCRVGEKVGSPHRPVIADLVRIGE